MGVYLVSGYEMPPYVRTYMRLPPDTQQERTDSTPLTCLPPVVPIIPEIAPPRFGPYNRPRRYPCAGPFEARRRRRRLNYSPGSHLLPYYYDTTIHILTTPPAAAGYATAGSGGV